MLRHAGLTNISLIVVGALPTLIALAICARMLWLIWPELEMERRYGALEGLTFMAAPGCMAAMLGLWGLAKRRDLPRFARLILLSFALICFYGYFHLPDPQPALRSWLFDADTYSTVIIAAQLPLFYFLVYLLSSAFAIESRRGLLWTGIATIAVPVTLYLGFHALRYLPHSDLFSHFAQIIFLSLNAAFSFLLLRLFLYASRHHAEKLHHPRTFAFMQFFFVGALPFLGLVLNAHGPLARESQMVLGNFSSFTIWLLALINALLFMLPKVENRRVALLLLALRAAGFIFVLYFCTVFLLFLPLALVLIVAFGLGFLLLIPYLAAAFQLVRLRRDIGELKLSCNNTTVIAAIAAGVLLLPALTLMHIYLDRARLVSTIQFVQRPPLLLDQQAPVSAETALEFAKPAERNSRGFRQAKSQLPIYDSLYRSIVFDGVELSENLRRRISRIFSAAPETAERARRTIPATAVLSELKTSARAQGKLTATTLRVRFSNDTSNAAEFSGKIELPDGVFVTGHWLTIDGVEIPAQITTKNTAIWVYDRITERQRDPSLIYYEAPNTLRWRVFPVPGHGFREARLELSHAWDAEIHVAGQVVALRSLAAPATAFVSTSGHTQLLGPANTGDSFRRNPYPHFVVDCSASAPGDVTGLAKDAAERLGLTLERARVSYVNSSIRTENFTGAVAMYCPTRTGGFFAELAIRAIAHDAYLAGGKTFPLIIILSPQKPALPWEELAFARAFYADADGFVHIAGNKTHAYNFSGGLITGGKPHFPLPVRSAGGRIVSAQPAYIPEANGSGEKLSILDGFEQHLAFWAGDTTARARAVITAIETNSLNPAAGSIVLETEAQRRKLDELHKQMLRAVNELDAGEPVRMSEPWLYLILFAALAAGKIRRRPQPR